MMPKVIDSKTIFQLSNEIFLKNLICMALFSIGWFGLFYSSFAFIFGGGIVIVAYVIGIFVFPLIQIKYTFCCLDNDFSKLRDLYKHPIIFLKALPLQIWILPIIIFLVSPIIICIDKIGNYWPPLLICPVLIIKAITPFLRPILLIMDINPKGYDIGGIQAKISRKSKPTPFRILGFPIMSGINFRLVILFISAFSVSMESKDLSEFLFPIFNRSLSHLFQIPLFLYISYFITVQATLFRIQSSCYFDDMTAPDKVEKWGECEENDMYNH